MSKEKVVGDVVLFGNYRQVIDNERIQWIVLNIEDDEALLISKYALDCISLEDDRLKWSDSYLRKWLNTTFLDTAFSDDEKDKIILTTVIDYPNEILKSCDQYKIVGDYQLNKFIEENEVDDFPKEREIRKFINDYVPNDTDDYVFLLSVNEIELYLKGKNEIKCIPTKFALTEEEKKHPLLYHKEGKPCWYWTRTMGLDTFAAVTHSGKISSIYLIFDDNTRAIRPAIKISVDDLNELDLYEYDLKKIIKPGFDIKSDTNILIDALNKEFSNDNRNEIIAFIIKSDAFKKLLDSTINNENVDDTIDYLFHKGYFKKNEIDWGVKAILSALDLYEVKVRTTKKGK